ncbi:DUF2846 domain-containing protein [Solimicrobium silvestre]|uniref:DUF2846 domain-containing protein n=1 Tax=Solimicrobium silvestre TaxID=2099400 RepID=A0A2S9H3G4_9BURK|nr:DUF2846 domain-containing protein [Solimicrobium silvestre]PRC94525.1 hypothetical protein S2091_0528 [Solimicrobium silvestre]
MKRIVGIFIAAMVVLLTGCASVPMASLAQDSKAKEFTPDQNKASLYIYRNETIGAAISMPVSVNGATIGETASKTYFQLDLLPGAYNLKSEAENDSNLALTLIAGKNYFVWQEVKMGIFSARNKLQLVDDETGRAGVTESKLILISSSAYKTPAVNQHDDKTPLAVVAPMVASAPITTIAADATVATNVQQSIPSSPLSSDPVAAKKVEFNFGQSSITVEKMAKQQNCNPGVGANLISKNGVEEQYSVKCSDGRELKAQCEYRQCAFTTQNTPVAAVTPVAPVAVISTVTIAPSTAQAAPTTSVTLATNSSIPASDNSNAVISTPVATQNTAPEPVMEAPQPEKQLNIVLGLGLTAGGDNLETTTYTNGSTSSIHAGSGVQFLTGLDYRINDSFSVQGTVGFQDMVSAARNGNVSFTRFPIELLGYYSLNKSWRIGGGVRFVQDPTLSGNGIGSNISVDFNNTVGSVLEVEYLANKHLGFKFRAVKESFTAVGQTESVNGDQFGFFTNFYF